MLLSSKLLAQNGFLHAFPTRDSDEAELWAQVGADAVVQVKQIHGAVAVEADQADAAEADAIIGRRAGASCVAVGVRVADCVPLLLADPETGDVAAVHAGWRGVVAGVVRAAAHQLDQATVSLRPLPSGVRPPVSLQPLPSGVGGARLLAAIGPCIGPCCFEVGRDVGASIAAACTPAAGSRSAGRAAPRVVVWEKGDKAYVDLRAAVRAQLMALGLAGANIEDVPGCTKHEPERFHSYRRDGPGSGRMLATIATRR